MQSIFRLVKFAVFVNQKRCESKYMMKKF